MNSPARTSLDERRQILRGELSLQRQEITHQLSPPHEAEDSFPRSVTMSLITQEPVLAAQLLTAITVFLVGPRFSKALAAAFTFSKIARSAAPDRRPRNGT